MIKNQKTYSQPKEQVQRDWHLIDARGQILGRLAVEIANKLIGKYKPTITPHVDGGDYVVVINAKDIAVTGDKMNKKIYRHHTGFPGGLREKTLGEMHEAFPTRVIERAVYNMLPKNRLRADRMTRLKVYADDQHKHASQLGSKSEDKE